MGRRRWPGRRGVTACKAAEEHRSHHVTGGQRQQSVLGGAGRTRRAWREGWNGLSPFPSQRELDLSAHPPCRARLSHTPASLERGGRAGTPGVGKAGPFHLLLRQSGELRRRGSPQRTYSGARKRRGRAGHTGWVRGWLKGLERTS